VLENRVLRRMFGLRKDEVTGGWRRLHNEELRDLYSSPSIIRMINSRRMRWAEQVARMEAKINTWESQRERDHLEDQDIGGWIILGWILAWCGLGGSG
jgi:hypothetical protein